MELSSFLICSHSDTFKGFFFFHCSFATSQHLLHTHPSSPRPHPFKLKLHPPCLAQFFPAYLIHYSVAFVCLAYNDGQDDHQMNCAVESVWVTHWQNEGIYRGFAGCFQSLNEAWKWLNKLQKARYGIIIAQRKYPNEFFSHWIRRWYLLEMSDICLSVLHLTWCWVAFVVQTCHHCVNSAVLVFSPEPLRIQHGHLVRETFVYSLKKRTHPPCLFSQIWDCQAFCFQWFHTATQSCKIRTDKVGYNVMSCVWNVCFEFISMHCVI